MKKRIVTLILMASMVFGLVGCAKTPCDWCGEEGHCKTYQNAFFGEMELCSDCQKDFGLK